MRSFSILTGLTAATCAAGASLAEDAITGLEAVGRPVAKATGFQPAATELARDQQWLDHALLWLCIVVSVFVVGLLAIVILRYNSRSNPVPAKFTHNTPLEIVWTLIPVVILVALGAFSLPILFKQLETPVAEVTIKATGNQWYWSYEYPDEGITFDSYLIGHPATLDSDLDKDAQPYVLNAAMEARLARSGYTKDDWLLATDNAVVIPVNKTVVVYVTGSDVIHGWYVPAFAVQHSAVPGRIAEVWFKAEKEGIYFGQCTTLCGSFHAYMPITVKVVSQETYDAWVAKSKTADAGAPAAPPGARHAAVRVAAAD